MTIFLEEKDSYTMIPYLDTGAKYDQDCSHIS